LDYEDFWFVSEGGAVLIVELPAKDQSYQKPYGIETLKIS
jgi:hypothetical protein